MKKVDLRGHAYDFFDTWNGEREGYGAYTYVLLRSAADLEQRYVRRRYEELLSVIQTQSDARDIRPKRRSRLAFSASRSSPRVSAVTPT